MALRLGFRKTYPGICGSLIQAHKHFSKQWQHLHNSSNLNNTTTTVDALDDFTTQLIQRKTEKWEIIRSKTNLHLKPCSGEKEQTAAIDICKLSLKQINDLLQDAIDQYNCSDILDIIKQCIQYDRCPNTEHVLQILSIRSRCGDKEIVLKLREFFRKHDENFLNTHANFDHYLAVSLWIKGNAVECLKLLDKVYREQNILRRRIRLTFKYLTMDATTNRSEAILVLLTKYLADIYKDFGDFYPLSCVWQECFLSEWYSDQQLALKLLQENQGLEKMVTNRIPFVVTSALRNHRIESVYRLLELLLEYDLNSEYSRVLRILFDYKCWQRDLRSCAEIIQWCTQYDVSLSPLQYNNFLALVLKNPKEMYSNVPKKPVVPSLKLKF